MARRMPAPAGHFQCAGRPASPPSRSPASSCSTCRSSRSSSIPSTPGCRSRSGRAFRWRWYQSAWQNDQVARCRDPLAGDRQLCGGDRDHRRDDGGAGHDPHPPLSRPHRHLCHDQHAADGAGDRHRRGAPHLLRHDQDRRPAIPASPISSPPTRPSAFPSPICRSGRGSKAWTCRSNAPRPISMPRRGRPSGASPCRLLWPGIIAGLMLAFVISLDDVVITELVKSGGQDTLPTYMLGQLRRVVTPEMNAISTVFLAISIALVTIFFVLNRRNA